MKTLTESQCIWMECGYIDYKLCDRNFDCEHCAFDKAIHAQRFSDATRKNIFCEEVREEKEINSNLTIDYFSKNHLWFCKVRDDEYLCGVDESASGLLNTAATLMFPENNITIPIGSPLFWIVTGSGVAAVTSPVDTKIIKSLHQDEKAIKREAVNWFAPLLSLTVSRFYSDAVFENGNPPYDEFVNSEKIKMKELIARENSHMQIGRTFYDGGVVNFNLLDKKLLHTLLQKTFSFNI